jgi:alkylation response protein AidB-like acyl-CoA dehydrogenase
MTESQADLLFDLTPTEEQALMRETARRFAAERMREASRDADEAGEAPEGFYEASTELGFTAVPIPEAFGGFGADRSPTGNVLIAEDLAYGDMSLAIGAMAPLSFVNTVIDQGSEAQKAKLLPPFADDAFRAATIALMEPGPRFDPTRLATRARKEGDGFVLDGAKSMVPLGGSAEVTLVVANLEGEGPAAFVVPKGTAGVQIERERYMGLKPLELSSLKLEGVKLPLDAKLGEGQAFDLARFVDLSRIGIGALALGVGRAILDYTKEYCNERVAFGEPITNRQAVAFMIANIAIELDGMRMMVYRAASRAEQGLPFRREATLARIQCARHSVQIGTDGVQLLGGHGFIREHMVELWYRNMNAIGILEGCVVV